MRFGPNKPEQLRLLRLNLFRLEPLTGIRTHDPVCPFVHSMNDEQFKHWLLTNLNLELGNRCSVRQINNKYYSILAALDTYIVSRANPWFRANVRLTRHEAYVHLSEYWHWNCGRNRRALNIHN